MAWWRSMRQRRSWRRDAHLQRLLDALPIALLKTDAAGRILFSNLALRKIVGRRAGELRRLPVAEVLPLDAADSEFVARGGGLFEADVQTPREAPVPRGWWRLQASPSRTPDGGDDGVLWTVVDVTEQKLAEREAYRVLSRLSAKASEWQTTFDAVELPIVVVDGQDLVERLNRTARDLAGASYQELVGTPLHRLRPTALWGTSRALGGKVRAGGSVPAHRLVDADSGRVWYLSVQPVQRDATNTSLVFCAREITELEALQEKLRRKEVLAALGSLVGSVAHEVRNPLFALSSALDLFELEFAGRSEVKEFVSLFRSELTRMLNLFQELLDYGRPRELDRRFHPPAEIAEKAISLCAVLARERGVFFRRRLAADLPPVYADASRMVGALKNLVENAVQHSQPADSVTVEAVVEGEALCFRVHDEGGGLDEADLDRVFEPFFTRRREGSGLGLAIAQRIVEQHGGGVRLANRPHGGTVAEISLLLSVGVTP